MLVSLCVNAQWSLTGNAGIIQIHLKPLQKLIALLKEAQVIVYDFNGITILKYDLKERGTQANFSINKRQPKLGTYFYTLITDRAVIGIKKMIVK